MSVSEPRKEESSTPAQGTSPQDGSPSNRLGLWVLLFVAVIVGLVLFFLFGRGVPSVL